MTIDEQHIDGNGIGGLLAEIARAEMTSVMRTCQSCGDRRALAEHRAYRTAGVVLRCPSCGDAAVVTAPAGAEVFVRLHGTFRVARAAPPGA